MTFNELIENVKGWSTTECLEIAWNEIKNRQGKMVDGVFVKAADLEEVRNDK